MIYKKWGIIYVKVFFYILSKVLENKDLKLKILNFFVKNIAK